MRKLYITLFSVLFFVSAALFAFSVNLGFKTQAAANSSFQIIDSAEVRIAEDEEDDTGIRFSAKIGKDRFEKLSSSTKQVVYFGIELTANGVSKDICYLVDDLNKITSATSGVTFGEGEEEFIYTASITYNRNILEKELSLDPNFNTAFDVNKSDAENLTAFRDANLLTDYLYNAYATEITAKAYYTIGKSGKVYGDGEVTRSMWGVASAAYSDDPEGCAFLAEQYFTVGTSETSKIIYETGELRYTLSPDDKVYIDAKSVSVTDGKLSLSALSEKNIGDFVTLHVINKNGVLTEIDCEIISESVAYTAQSFYDAAADKIYYLDNGEQKTLSGSAEETFKYVVNNAESYALTDYSGGSLKSNVNYKYADSVTFDYTSGGTETTSNMTGLNPRIITSANSDGYVTAVIPYNPQTNEYTGVKLSVESEGVKYAFTDTVIISQMIDDATELMNIFNKADETLPAGSTDFSKLTYNMKYGTITKGVYMLAGNIDASSGYTFNNSYFNFFEGVFDGRGFNIYDLDVSGTENNPGNGLFSAISQASVIQNVGFINVKASYGSVFQGNLFDIGLSSATVIGTYAAGPGWDRTKGTNVYREQLGITDDTKLISEYLKSTSRRGMDVKRNDATYAYQAQNIWTNVYVKVAPTTKRLMGVISRNMINGSGNLHANNMVIEYLPEQIFDTTAGANDGALPLGYNYTNGVYGVLFGGAYDVAMAENQNLPYYNGTSYNRYDTPAGYCSGNTAETGMLKSYYTPTGTETTQGALTFSYSRIAYRNWSNHRIYVISPIKLVSSVSGAILGTNEQVDATNLYKFVAQTPNNEIGDVNYAGQRSKLERYDSYAAATSTNATNLSLTSFIKDNGAEDIYWNIDSGYLKWIIK